MGIFRLKRKTYSVYDETDNLKRMKDSDILAEKERYSDITPVVLKTAGGAVIGSTVLGAATMGKELLTPNEKKIGKKTIYQKEGRLARAGKGLKRGGKFGAIAGAALAGGVALHQKTEEQERNSAYNSRLRYAQNQARRREKIDWKKNMTTRDGYSY